MSLAVFKLPWLESHVTCDKAMWPKTHVWQNSKYLLSSIYVTGLLTLFPRVFLENLRKSILKLLEWVSESRYNTNKQIDKIYLCAKLLQSCLPLWDPMECSLPIPSVHGILQARIPGPVAVPSSEGSDPHLICIGRQVFYHHCHLGSPFMGETTSQFKGSGGSGG